MPLFVRDNTNDNNNDNNSNNNNNKTEESTIRSTATTPSTTTPTATATTRIIYYNDNLQRPQGHQQEWQQQHHHHDYNHKDNNTNQIHKLRLPPKTRTNSRTTMTCPPTRNNSNNINYHYSKLQPMATDPQYQPTHNSHILFHSPFLCFIISGFTTPGHVLVTPHFPTIRVSLAPIPVSTVFDLTAKHNSGRFLEQFVGASTG